MELPTGKGREDGLSDGLPECVSANGAGEVCLKMQMLGGRIMELGIKGIFQHASIIPNSRNHIRFLQEKSED